MEASNSVGISHLMISAPAIESSKRGRPPGGIDGFPAERSKTGYENFHECGIPFL